ncbi:unnamed protein product [Gongylonema pulchrum]|uniref:BRCT domain-containing protein n=1 Tax=Gongylonema pulchrum TaxID=637853 RepID=A0A183CUF7_9BILA|nr:unnamed protein product [Gongylonema pulchrum]
MQLGEGIIGFEGHRNGQWCTASRKRQLPNQLWCGHTDWKMDMEESDDSNCLEIGSSTTNGKLPGSGNGALDEDKLETAGGVSKANCENSVDTRRNKKQREARRVRFRSDPSVCEITPRPEKIPGVVRMPDDYGLSSDETTELSGSFTMDSDCAEEELATVKENRENGPGYAAVQINNEKNKSLMTSDSYSSYIVGQDINSGTTSIIGDSLSAGDSVKLAHSLINENPSDEKADVHTPAISSPSQTSPKIKNSRQKKKRRISTIWVRGDRLRQISPKSYNQGKCGMSDDDSFQAVISFPEEGEECIEGASAIEKNGVCGLETTAAEENRARSGQTPVVEGSEARDAEMLVVEESRENSGQTLVVGKSEARGAEMPFFEDNGACSEQMLVDEERRLTLISEQEETRSMETPITDLCGTGTKISRSKIIARIKKWLESMPEMMDDVDTLDETLETELEQQQQQQAPVQEQTSVAEEIKKAKIVRRRTMTPLEIKENIANRRRTTTSWDIGESMADRRCRMSSVEITKTRKNRRRTMAAVEIKKMTQTSVILLECELAVSAFRQFLLSAAAYFRYFSNSLLRWSIRSFISLVQVTGSALISFRMGNIRILLSRIVHESCNSLCKLLHYNKIRMYYAHC